MYQHQQFSQINSSNNNTINNDNLQHQSQHQHNNKRVYSQEEYGSIQSTLEKIPRQKYLSFRQDHQQQFSQINSSNNNTINNDNLQHQSQHQHNNKRVYSQEEYGSIQSTLEKIPRQEYLSFRQDHQQQFSQINNINNNTINNDNLQHQ